MTTSEHLYYNCLSVVYRAHQSDYLKCSKDSFNYVRRCHEIDFDRAKTWTPRLKNRLTLVETGMASRPIVVTAKIQKRNPWNKIYSLCPFGRHVNRQILRATKHFNADHSKLLPLKNVRFLLAPALNIRLHIAIRLAYIEWMLKK